MSASSLGLAREKGARDEAPRRRLNCNVQVLPEILVEAQRHRCVLAGGHVDLKAGAGVNAITAGEGKVLAHHGSPSPEGPEQGTRAAGCSPRTQTATATTITADDLRERLVDPPAVDGLGMDNLCQPLDGT